MKPLTIVSISLFLVSVGLLIFAVVYNRKNGISGADSSEKCAKASVPFGKCPLWDDTVSVCRKGTLNNTECEWKQPIFLPILTIFGLICLIASITVFGISFYKE